jgi:hypothetical protein
MTSWIRGGPVDKAHLGRLFLGRDAEDALVRLLHDAAPRINLAIDHAELGDAATKIAAAILIVGPDRWSRFLAELEDCAATPTTAAPHAGHAHQPPCPEATLPVSSPEPTPTDAGPSEPVAGRPDGEHPVQNDPAPANPAHMPSHGAAGPGEHPGSWRMPSAGVVPPVRNPARLRPGHASRPAWSAAPGRSLWDEQGGEWQYQADDGWRHPHWDYNAHQGPNTPWRSIPMTGRSLWKA